MPSSGTLPHDAERHPRVELHPPYTDTYGAEAAELAAAAGLVADFWQARAVELLLAFRDDRKWVCRDYCEWVARQNGKGGILEIRVLAGLFLLDEKLILWSAHEYKTAQEAFRRVWALIKNLGRPFTRRGSEYVDVDGLTVKVNQTNGEEGFEILETGQRLKFVARSKGSGRGFSGDLIIIDEAFAFTFAQQEALGPTLRARPNPQVIYTSSPPLDGVTGEVMFKLRKRAESDAPGRLGYRDWGAGSTLEDLAEMPEAERTAWLDDRARWYATNPALGVRVTEEAMQDDRDGMSDSGFAREILGVWPKPVESAGGTIDPDTWADRLDAESKLPGRVRFALDTSPDRSNSTVAVAGRRADGRFHVEVIDAKPGTGWVVARTAELYRRWDCGPVGIDPRSAAGAFIQPLIEAGVEVELITTAELGQATGEFIDAITNDQLRHLGQQSLTTAVLGGQLRPLGDAYAWARRDASVDITPLVAASLALHGAAAHTPEDVEPWVMTEDDWEDED